MKNKISKNLDKESKKFKWKRTFRGKSWRTI